MYYLYLLYVTLNMYNRTVGKILSDLPFCKASCLIYSRTLWTFDWSWWRTNHVIVKILSESYFIFKTYWYLFTREKSQKIIFTLKYLKTELDIDIFVYWGFRGICTWVHTVHYSAHFNFQQFELHKRYTHRVLCHRWSAKML